MRMLKVAFLVAVFGVASHSGRACAQRADSTSKSRPTPVDPRDTVFLRARRLVLDGHGAAGRALVDSALKAADGTPDFATALYWRGALASTAADAERDYRRVIVEYPFSPHSGDALLALAQLEMARADREPAIDHLQRFLLQQPNDPDRVRAGIWLGRMLLEQNQLSRGCAVLLRTRSSLGDTAIETRNQVDYYAARCVGVDTTAPPARVAAAPVPPIAKPPRNDTIAPRASAAGARVTPRAESVRTPARSDSVRRSVARDTVRPDSVRRPARSRDTAAKDSSRRTTAATPPAETPSTSKRFTVQVAAFDTREAAEQLVTRLKARGIVARAIESKSAPYRVRVGHYATDADAAKAARELKDKGIVGFVTTTDNERAPAPGSR